jgi:hypothetical protein
MDRFIRPAGRYFSNLNARSWAWILVSLFGFVTLTSLPKLRALYESRLQKKLDAVNFAELPLTHDPRATLGGDEAIPADDFGGEEEEESGDGSEDGAGDDSTEGSNSGGLTKTSWEGEWDSSKKAEVSSSGRTIPGSQVWRFTIRTDSPQDLRGKIQEILLQAGTAPTSRMIHGFVAPGGIQFDVLVPADSIPKIQEALKSLSDEHSPPEEASASDSPYPTQPFTWYRNRSKRPLPSGAARVVIWLSLT